MLTFFFWYWVTFGFAVTTGALLSEGVDTAMTMVDREVTLTFGQRLLLVVAFPGIVIWTLLLILWAVLVERTIEEIAEVPSEYAKLARGTFWKGKHR